MNKTTINIDTDVEDTYLKNEQEWMCRIVDAAHRFDTVIIPINEGPALEELNYKGKKFLEILKELCESNKWKQTKFQFETMNWIQDKNVWPSIKLKPSARIFFEKILSVFKI